MFFDFHHHHLDWQFGIYNHLFKESVPQKWFSVGLHPKDIDAHWEKKMNVIQNIAENQNCIAIGECGLDANVWADSFLQQRVLHQHIHLANQLNKPVIIHCVRRFQELIVFQKTAKVPLVIHGFNKSEKLAMDLIKHGFYLSFGKALLHVVSLQDYFSKIPIEKIFLETDNSEIEIQLLYEKAAFLHSVSINALQSQMLENLKKITHNG